MSLLTPDILTLDLLKRDLAATPVTDGNLTAIHERIIQAMPAIRAARYASHIDEHGHRRVPQQGCPACRQKTVGRLEDFTLYASDDAVLWWLPTMACTWTTPRVAKHTRDALTRAIGWGISHEPAEAADLDPRDPEIYAAHLPMARDLIQVPPRDRDAGWVQAAKAEVAFVCQFTPKLFSVCSAADTGNSRFQPTRWNGSRFQPAWRPVFSDLHALIEDLARSPIELPTEDPASFDDDPDNF